MGQKIHPIGFRLAVGRKYKSSWFAASNVLFAALLKEDISIRKYLDQELNKKKKASVARIEIERPAKNIRITIHTGRPGVVIGKKGEGIDLLKTELHRRMGVPVHINIEEIRKPETDAQLIADSIAQQLERRIMFRRAMKRALQSAMRFGVQGIKITCAGRLNGIEIARTEWYLEGRMPLHTISLDIDWGQSIAQTQYGAIGVTVLVFKGETLKRTSRPITEIPEEKRPRHNPRPARTHRDGSGPRLKESPTASKAKAFSNKKQREVTAHTVQDIQQLAGSDKVASSLEKEQTQIAAQEDDDVTAKTQKIS